MFNFSLELSDNSKNTLNAFEKKLKVDFFAKIVIKELKKESNSFFNKEEDPDHIFWIPSNRVIKKGGKTLHDTGFLEESMQKNETYIIEGNSILVKPNVFYAKFNQFGTKNKNGSIRNPRRRFSGLTNESKEHLKNIAKNYSVGFSNL